MKKALSFFIVLLLASAVSGAKTEFKVTFVSADHVYIDGGRADGLLVGDKFILTKLNNLTEVLEIVFISEHSSSCTILDKKVVIATGDLLSISAASLAWNKLNKGRNASLTDTTLKSVPAPVRVSGSAAFIQSQWVDKSPANLDFSQSSARMNFTAANLFKENVTLAVKTRGRYDVRTKSYDGGTAKTAWENRIWELSLSYYDPNEALSFGVGRILSRHLRGVGYLDGAMADLKISNGLSVGIFGGAQPDWAYSVVASSITKAGFYTEYKTKREASTQLIQSIGFVEELYSGEVSRTFVASSGNVRFGPKWGFFHNTEVDINSGWRKAKAGNSIVFSNLYVNAYYQLSPKVRTSLNYDKRENYWSYQYRSLNDSLFDDRINQGLRTAIDFSPTNRLWLSGSLGYRKHDQERDGTVSYSSNARLASIFNKGVSLSTLYAGFNGPFENGTNYRVGIDFDLKNVGAVTVGFSKYTYSVAARQSRSSRSIELGIFKNIARNYYIGSNFSSDNGSDIDGVRLQFEFGVRY